MRRLLIVLLLLLSGCESVTGTADRTPLPTERGPGRAIAAETVVGGLEVPWGIGFAGDGRILLTERPGRLLVINDGAIQQSITVPDVDTGGEGGLLGLALHPEFDSNGQLYLYHTYSGDGTLNRVVRYTLSEAQLTDQQVLLDNIPGAGIHNGGRLAFGPDGALYITAGDAADQPLSQQPGSLAGKILRLNADGSVPADNPFPGSPVYSYGHRNPQGLTWDAAGQLYATEHGPSARDEVNVIEAGTNYGWPEISGDEQREGMRTPLVHSGSQTWAPSGAVIVSGEKYPGLEGQLLYAGLRSNTLWQLDLNAQDAQPQPLLEGYGRLRTVVQAPDGTLYVLTNNRDGRGRPASDDDLLLRLVAP